SALTKSPIVDASAALSGTSAVVLAENPTRQFLFLANTDASIVIWVRVNQAGATSAAAANAAGSFSLAAGAHKEISEFVPTGAISAIAASGTPNLTVYWA